jgi:hypothetical protein
MYEVSDIFSSKGLFLIQEFQSARGASLNALGITMAQVAFIGFPGFRIRVYHFQGAIFGAQSARYAFILIHNNGSCFLVLKNCLGGTDPETHGVYAVFANNRDVGQVFPEVFDPEHGFVRIISSEHVHRTGSPAKRTACAQVKMGTDEFSRSLALHANLLMAGVQLRASRSSTFKVKNVSSVFQLILSLKP